MNRALLTVNFNDALCENSRASMRAACERWGSEFIELNEGFFADRPKPAVSPASLKCFCFELTDAEEILILDADVVVSSACPNPFEEGTGPELIAVQNGSERFQDLWQIRSCEVYEWEKLRREEPRLANAQYVPGRYFNTGVLFVKRKHHKAMFDLIADIVQVDHGLGWNDQTPINMCAVACGVKVFLASEWLNFIHPCMLGEGWMRMKAHIYHGAGEPDRINWLPKVQWQL